MSFAIDYLHEEKGNVLGINVAIHDLTKAWIKYTRQEKILCHCPNQSSQKSFLSIARTTESGAEERCSFVNPHQTEQLEDISCLFVPDPDFSRHVWRRSCAGLSHVLCGLVHTLSGEQVTRALLQLYLAPCQKRDALICPSNAIRDAVLTLWEIQGDYLRHRLGGQKPALPQTPVIPLGIDTQAFAARSTPEKRAEQRTALGLAEDEVAILFVGRLSFATKAHPLPLLLALRDAAQQTGKRVRLLLYGYFQPIKEMEPRFHALINDFSANFRCDVVPNSDPRFPEGLWAAADIFTSLADNVQESFGLTPLEAMACGLPSVISDWDGYRDGIRDGIDGFRIPTTLPPKESGLEIAQRYFEDNNYGTYLIGAAQSTAIDIPAATQAFATLIQNEPLRKKMGASARERARSTYDWQVIIRAYEDLWQEMGMTNVSAPSLPTDWQAVHLHYPNPLSVFAGFSTQSLSPQTLLTVSMEVEDIQKILRHDMNLFLPDLLLPVSLLLSLIETVRAHGSIEIQTLLAISPEEEHPRLWRSLSWMLKHGVCRVIEEKKGNST